MKTIGLITCFLFFALLSTAAIDGTAHGDIPKEVTYINSFEMNSWSVEHDLPFDSIPKDSIQTTTLPPVFMKVKMINGEEFRGEVITMDEVHIRLKTTYADLTLDRSQIKSFETIYNIKPRTSNASNYFIAPNAIPEEGKRFTYRNTLGVINTLEIKILNNVSVDVGFEALSLLNNQVPILTAGFKSGFQINDNLHAGLAVRHIQVLPNRYITLALPQLTFGKQENNLSVGVGFGGSSNGPFRRPIIALSGTIKTGEKISLVMENYYSPQGLNYNSSLNSIYFGTYGLRFHGKKNNNFDLGVVVLKEKYSRTIAFPLVSYAHKF